MTTQSFTAEFILRKLDGTAIVQGNANLKFDRARTKEEFESELLNALFKLELLNFPQ